MAANDKVLGTLHEKVAQALTEQVEGFMEEKVVGEDVVEVMVRPSPALLSAAIAFLKNNNITADATENEALRALGDTLKARRQKKLPQAALDEAAELYTSASSLRMQ